jgi:crossover junction endodeoxyribonuclease RuvC
MKIIGIDPALIKTGWGVISIENNVIKYIASGTIKINPKLAMAERLKGIYDELNEIINLYKPDEFAIEETFVNKNPVSSLKLGQARGVAMLAGSLAELKVFEYSPNFIKKCVVGVGKAEKRQVMAMIKYILPSVELKGEDEADALAVAICHGNSREIRLK